MRRRMSIMKTSTKVQKLGLICAFIAVGTFISACDSSELEDGDFETTEVQDLYSVVSSELALSSNQQARFQNTLRLHDGGDREPGYLWRVADSLAQTLSADQKERLINRTDSYEGFHPFQGLRGTPGGGGYYGFGGLRGAMGQHGESGADAALNLTEEQQDAFKAAHQRGRAAMNTLRERHRNGELTNEEFVAELVRHREQMREMLRTILTAEQIATLEDYRLEREAEFEAFRTAVWEVRDEVLGLTAEQSAAFNALLEEQLNMREVLMEQFEAGEITREGLRDEVDALRSIHVEALQALLSEEQFEIVQIHAALIIRVGMRGHHRMGGGPGQGGGPDGGGGKGFGPR
ncbi:hypothetical protein ACFLRO_00030 [Bacteroidota bacterium]